MRAQAQSPASRLPQGAQPTIAKPKPKPKGTAKRPTDYLMKDLISPDGGYKGAKASIAQSDPTKSVRILPDCLTFSTQLLGDVVNACVLDPRKYPQSHSYDGVRRTLDVKLGTLKGKVRPASGRVERKTLYEALCKALGIFKGVKYQRQSPDMELIYRIERCISIALLDSDANIRHPCIDGFMSLVRFMVENGGNTLQMPVIPQTSEPCSPPLPPLFDGGVLEQHPTRFERVKLT